MTAEDARKLTAQALDAQSGRYVPELVAHALQLIEDAAREGLQEIRDPFSGLRMPITEQHREAAYDALVARGFDVEHHPDPDPGHPCSRSYTSVSW